jgi:Protein of unknown function (DUF3618)
MTTDKTTNGTPSGPGTGASGPIDSAATSGKSGSTSATDSTSSGSRPRPGHDPQEIRADIEATRDELGDSVAALAAKADVKARAQETATAAKERTKDAVEQVAATARRRRGPLAVVIAGVAAAGSAIGIAKRRTAKAKQAKARNQAWRRWLRRPR